MTGAESAAVTGALHDTETDAEPDTDTEPNSDTADADTRSDTIPDPRGTADSDQPSIADPESPHPHQDPRFRRFWLGFSVSQLGDRVTELALPLIASVTLHANPVEASILAAATWTPNLVGVFLGAWVDRQRRKRRLMIAADLARAAILLSLPIAAVLHAVTLGQLYLVALLCGIAAVLFNTSYSSFFARLVPRSQYVSANSKLSASRSASFMLGPAAGGALIAATSAPFAVAADAMSFLFSAFTINRVPVTEPEPEAADVSVARRAKEGIVYIVRQPILRSTLACATTINFFTFIANTSLVILFANQVLHLSGTAIGLAQGLGAAGSLVGAVAAPRVARLVGVGRSAAIGAVLFPAPIAIAAVAHGSVWWCAAALAATEFFCGLGVMLFDIPLNSLQAAVVPNGVRSRVAGAWSTVNYGIRPVGALVGGGLAAAVGMRATLVVAAVGGAMSVCWLLAGPVLRIRSLEDDLDAVGT